ISGNSAALERAVQAAEQAGARKIVRLAVSIAAHSHLMARAQDEFNQAVAETRLQQPHIPVIGNVSARPLTTAAEIRADLQAQLTHRVRWTESMQFLRAQGIDTFIEIGSGEVLCGLVKRIDRKTTRLSLGEAADFEKLQANAV
ncbi:MAG: ACP S-malonyltransferase, partial [Anaerolineae bacterium]